MKCCRKNAPGNLSEVSKDPVGMHSVEMLCCARTNVIGIHCMLKVMLGENEINLSLQSWLVNILVGCSIQNLIVLCY